MDRSTTEAGRLLVGTSGWQYSSWRESFYGNAQPSLERYATRLDTVEVNGTFYSLPDPQSVQEWAHSVPDDFVFSVKASRYLTHMKKLKDPEEPLARLLEAIGGLRDHLEVILFQLPPRWRANPKRLARFLNVLPDRYRYAFEFRDPSWHSPAVYELLRGHGAAFCIYHLGGVESPREVTADFVYIRLHGARDRYVGSYSPEVLAGWAGALSSWSRSGRDVYVYFDNDQQAAAPRDAARLAVMTR